MFEFFFRRHCLAHSRGKHKSRENYADGNGDGEVQDVGEIGNRKSRHR